MSIKLAKINHQVAVGSLENRRISLGQSSQGVSLDVPTEVKFDGSIYLVGENVEKYETPDSGFDTSRLVDGPDMYALLYAGWAAILPEKEITFEHVTVGLPVALLQSAKAERYKAVIKKRLVSGYHSFTVNDKHYRVKVNKITVLPQPVGAVYQWGFNDRGKWARSKTDYEAAIAICDIGYMSTDLFVCKGPRILYVHTKGCPGMVTAIREVQKQLVSQHGVHFEPSEIDKIMHGESELNIATGRIDVTGIIERAKSKAANKILTQMRDSWGDGMRFPHIRIVGGGAIDIGEKIIDEYPTAVIPEKPVLSNAIGLTRYSRSIEAGNICGADLGQGNYKIGVILG